MSPDGAVAVAQPATFTANGRKLLLMLAIFMFVAMAASLVAGAVEYYRVASGAHKAQAAYSGLTDDNIVEVAVGTFALMVAGPVMWVIAKGADDASSIMAAVGLHRKPSLLRSSTAVFAMAAAAALSAAFAVHIIGVDHGAGADSHPFRALSPLSLALVAACAGLGEEVLFRGFLLPRIGLVLQAMAFALAHANNASPVQLAVTLASGLVYGLAARRIGSVWPCAIAHASWDMAVMLVDHAS